MPQFAKLPGARACPHESNFGSLYLLLDDFDDRTGRDRFR
jgi:hypothetical protein